MFIKYQHLERFGTTEVSGIEIGDCFVFPKIDGTNASVWFEEGIIKAGSRTRELSEESDNAGFFKWVKEGGESLPIIEYLINNPTHRLFGEWLVPHSLRTYREETWRKFYVFDVAVEKDESELTHEGDSRLAYLPYDSYKSELERYGIEYIPPLCILRNSNYDQIIGQLEKNTFLIQDGKGAGEGIVLKNYDFKNKYGRQIWAKIVTSEFKEKHAREFGGGVIKGKAMVEEEIAEKYVTKALCEKVFSKIEVADGWTSKYIPRLLNTVYYDLVQEDCWNFIKENKNPTVNFQTLQHFTFKKVKEQLPHLF